MRIEPVNEQAMMIYLGDTISDAIAAQVNQATNAIQTKLSEVVIDIVPSYNSILVSFDLRHTDHYAMAKRLRDTLVNIESDDAILNSTVVEIPVYYGEEVALDMDDVCQLTGCNKEEVMRLHSEQLYRVYAIGFSPGFAYLGSLVDSLHVPRKQTPRLRVPAGSVGLADTQTAIYPNSTPGGWQIIGRTPINMLDWQSDSLSPVGVGNNVRFYPISKQEYLDQGGEL